MKGSKIQWEEIKKNRRRQSKRRKSKNWPSKLRKRDLGLKIKGKERKNNQNKVKAVKDEQNKKT